MDYLANDFRDKEHTTHLRGKIDLKSDSLPLDIFEDDWDSLPSHSKTNSAFGGTYFDLYYNFYDIKLGLFQEKDLNLNINDGFIQTWYGASNDFTILLNKTTIGDEIDYLPIKGEANYYYTKGLYLQKILRLTNKQYFSLKAKLYDAKDMQVIKVNGSNSNKQFKLSVDYYFSNKNMLIKEKFQDDQYSGKGYGFDLEYIYNNDYLYIYAGILNIRSHINWNSITHFQAEFDSNFGYDEQNNYKPFGTKSYTHDINYKQKIPIYYKTTIDYKLNKSISIGDNINGYKDIYFNEFYTNFKINKYRYKLGYIYESKNIIFGALFEDIKFYDTKLNNIYLEISNKYGTSTKTIQAKYHISF